jgi:hypothetical protein
MRFTRGRTFLTKNQPAAVAIAAARTKNQNARHLSRLTWRRLIDSISSSSAPT